MYQPHTNIMTKILGQDAPKRPFYVWTLTETLDSLHLRFIIIFFFGYLPHQADLSCMSNVAIPLICPVFFFSLMYTSSTSSLFRSFLASLYSNSVHSFITE